MEKIKVLHLSSEKTWRGGEQQIAYLIEELQNKEVENFVFCRKNSAFEKYCQKNNISYKSAPFLNSADAASAYKLAKWAQELKPDIIHTHSARSHAIAIMATFFGVKSNIIVSKRTDFEVKSNFFTKWRYNHPQIKYILCVSNKINEITKESVKIREKVQTVYSGIESSLINEREKSTYLRDTYNIDPSMFLIGNTSALANQKDYFTFIDAVKLMHKDDPKVHFIIIGSGPMETIIKEYAHNQNVSKYITFTGFIKDVKYKVHELDCFLITSKTEGLGTSILDAFAAKVPVVATKAGGIPELIMHRKTGLLHNIKDSEALAKSVLQIKKDKTLREQLTHNATEHLKTHFLKEITAQQTYEFYKKSLGL